MVRVLSVLVAAASASGLVPSASFNSSAEGALCNPCFQIGGQGINSLLNYILNVGVVGGCGSLCAAALPAGGAVVVACELVCADVGIKAFVAALEKVDLDPIYFCEEVHACPMAPDDAYLELVNAAANPVVVRHGDDIQMGLELKVTNDTGVGQFGISIDGPGTATPFSQSFFLKKGIPAGEQMLSVTLTLEDGEDEQGFPKTFEQGDYSFTFHVCQGECGSSHPHSKDFGVMSGTFTINGTAPAPPPQECFSQFDEDSCTSTKDFVGKPCQWCDDFFTCQDSVMPCNGIQI